MREESLAIARLHRCFAKFLLLVLLCVGTTLKMSAECMRDERLSVAVAQDCEGMGTVTGSKKDVKSGTKVTVKATAAKGHAFAGWYEDDACVSDAASYSFSMTDADRYLEARFIAARDDELYVANDGDLRFETGDSIDDIYDGYCVPFVVHSGSSATISVKGQPSGTSVKVVRQEDSCNYEVRMSGILSKRGAYQMTCTAKNANGYQASSIIRIGVDTDIDTDYDEIGLESVSELYGMRVGCPVSLCLNANLKSVTGLPSGLEFKSGSLCDSSGSCTACSDFVRGTPTKAGYYTMLFVDRYGRRASYTVQVEDAEMRYFGVNVGEQCRNYGTVSGSGIYSPLSTVKLSAKPASGCYFAGWYTDSDCQDPFSGGKSGDWRTASDTFVFGSLDGEVQDIYARFVTKAQDAWLSISGDEDWYVGDDDEDEGYVFSIDSMTVPKITVKNLPAGIKQSGMRFVVSDRSKLLPGVTEVTISAKNLSGASSVKRVIVHVPNLQSDVFGNLNYFEGYRVMRGVSGECSYPCCEFGIEDGWTVSAQDLPPGLSFAQTGVYGSGYGIISGVATKPGAYTVRLTAKKGSRTEVATISIVVDPLPDWAVGTFCALPDAEKGVGSSTLTVSDAGKISGKFLVDGKTWTFSSPMFDSSDSGYLSVAGVAKSGSLSSELTICMEDAGVSDGIASAQVSVSLGGVSFQMWRNLTADKNADSLTKAIQGIYTIQLSSDETGFGYLSATVSKSGMKVTGKLPDGTSVSSSLPVLYTSDGYILPWYLVLGSYKGGFVSALLKIDGYGEVYAESANRWCNYAKGVSEDYEYGFDRELYVSGAYYDKLANIADYYEGLEFSAQAPGLTYARKCTDVEYDDNDRARRVTSSEWAVADPAADVGVSIALDGSGKLSVPKASSPQRGSEPGEWYYEGDNLAALSVSFAKATGIFKGSFTCWYDYVAAVDYTREENQETWSHVSKKVSFEGVWVQGEGLRGFYLWDETGSYFVENRYGDEEEKTYKFKKSYSVSLSER